MRLPEWDHHCNPVGVRAVTGRARGAATTHAAARPAVVSYYALDRDMDTPRLLSRIAAPVLVIAGSEDKVVAGLIEKTEPLADGDKVELLVMHGADHFFRDLYAEEIADVAAERVAE